MTAAPLSKYPTSSRYEIIAKIASGGMATVYLGALKGPFGFEQLVAIKKLHAHLLDDPGIRESLLHEARLASRIRHANVVDVRDIEVADDDVQLVMTYIEGAPLSTLMAEAARRHTQMPIRVVMRIVLDACAGLQAAHELTDSVGKPLALVHRDISPQNVLVGVDGIARITDFGVARDESSNRQHTHTGALKGKFAYMAPEYIRGEQADQRVDIFALAIVLWEALTGRRLFRGNNDADTITRVTSLDVPRVSPMFPELGEGIDDVFEKALSKNPRTRFSTARAFGSALEEIALQTNMVATAAEVGQYVREHVADELARLERLRLAAARGSRTNEISPPSPPISVFPSPDILVRDRASVSVTMPEEMQEPANDDTRVAPARYQEKVTTMMGDDEQASSGNDAPSSPRRDLVPTLRTPNADIVETPTLPVTIIQAAPKGDDPLSWSGRLITERMPPAMSMRNLVFQRSPGSDPISDPPPTMRPGAPVTISNTPPVGMSTLPISEHYDAKKILPFNHDKPVSPRSSRLRWLLAACILFVLSGVGVVLFTGPMLR